MPTSGPFFFPGDDRLLQEPYQFDVNFDSSPDDADALLKDTGFMGSQSADGGDGNVATVFDFSTYVSNSQPILGAEKSNPHLLSHRGSTSSSSSLRSTDSNSPHTSVDAIPMDTSANDWLEDFRGDGGTFDMDETVDISRYLTLSGSSSSPDPPPVTEPEPEPDISAASEALAQGRASKRRKAQPKKPTKQSSNRSTNKIRTKSLTDFSPISVHGPSGEASPGNLYGNTLTSPESYFNNFSDVSSGVPMRTTNWQSTTNGQVGNTNFPVPGSDPIYLPPAHHGLPNGGSTTLMSHPLMPRLVIQAMPNKSRVETQIPLKITLHNLPKGIKKVHLPAHTIAKPKLLQKPSTGPSPDTLELTTMLVCTSAMSDEAKMKRAFERAGRKLRINEPNNPVDSIEDEENKPENGGEVRICDGCITRERKRAGRKKHKKPEEEELWDRYEHERAIVFNTQEVKEWQTVTPVMADPTGAGLINGAIPEGTVQVDAPMRIACYCRHHGEKFGFQVIITLKDHLGNIVAQGISTSIMITDDHKTPTPACPAPTPQPPSQSQPQLQHMPQSLVNNGPPLSSQPDISQPATAHTISIPPRGAPPLTPFRLTSEATSSLPFRQTHSTSDSHSLGHNHALANPSGSHPNNSQPMATATATATTPLSHSRQASPASPLGSGNRKRKASGVGRVPPGLAMTKIEAPQSLPSIPLNVHNGSAAISAGNSPFSPNSTHVPLNGDISNKGQLHMLNNGSQSLGIGPTTPSGNGTEPFMFSGMNNGPGYHLFSAPVSAHPSRAPSPSQLRPDPQNLQLSQRPQDTPPAILRIIPNEGSKCGGAEITVLGSNFTNDGLEVYFGSQKAITTTYWGPTSLVCMLPPSPTSGPVPVTIKQPGRPQLFQQPALFNYRDDGEDQLIRTALGVLASQYGRMRADPADFARSILLAHTSAPGSSNQSPHANGNNNFNRFSLESGEAVESSLLRILEVIDLDHGPHRARIDLRRSSGQTMLHLASSLGFVRFVAGLLSRGANVHIKDNGGFTPLHMAAMNNHPEIVRRLIAKGADRNALSYSGLTPTDVARSSPVRRSLRHTDDHFRSRSVDSRPGRISSPSPARSLWESSAVTMAHRREFMSDSFDSVTTAQSNNSSLEATTDEERDWHDQKSDGFAGLSRRSTVETHATNELDESSAAPNATMAAIREQVATQLQQFQHIMAMHLQNLPQFQMPNMPQMPNLPPMPVLPGYQAYLQSAPVMQRISSLVPNIRGQRQEPAGDQTSNATENRWGVFPFFGNKDSPPAYEDIFPQKDLDVKQSSAAQAAAEFEADAKCAALYDQDPAAVSQTPEVPALLQIGHKHLFTKEQQETLQRAHAQRLKTGSSDKMLWFVWIPILVLVLGLMLWGGPPSFLSDITSVVTTLIGLVTHPRDTINQVRNIVQELA